MKCKYNWPEIQKFYDDNPNLYLSDLNIPIGTIRKAIGSGRFNNRKKKAVSEQDRNNIVRDYLLGLSWRLLSKKYSVSFMTVSKILSEKKISRHRPKTKEYNLEEAQKIYNSELINIKSLSFRTGIPLNYIRKSIKKGTFKIKSLSQWQKTKNNFPKLSDSAKLKLSLIMKERHSKGLAYTLGHNQNKGKSSYPEQWFEKVIYNEFKNKNYTREHILHRFSLDFAWINLKKCIEMDGEQHQRFQKQIDSDIQRDKILKDLGWETLRIPWKDCYREPKIWIKKAFDFIHSS